MKPKKKQCLGFWNEDDYFEEYVLEKEDVFEAVPLADLVDVFKAYGLEVADVLEGVNLMLADRAKLKADFEKLEKEKKKSTEQLRILDVHVNCCLNVRIKSLEAENKRLKERHESLVRGGKLFTQCLGKENKLLRKKLEKKGKLHRQKPYALVGDTLCGEFEDGDLVTANCCNAKPTCKKCKALWKKLEGRRKK